jgi:hypothetical protein
MRLDGHRENFVALSASCMGWAPQSYSAQRGGPAGTAPDAARLRRPADWWPDGLLGIVSSAGAAWARLRVDPPDLVDQMPQCRRAAQYRLTVLEHRWPLVRAQLLLLAAPRSDAPPSAGRDRPAGHAHGIAEPA